MTNKGQCGIVQNLIPLVIDDVACEESRKFVEDHLAECEACRAIMEKMKAEIAIGNIEANDENFVRLCLKVRRGLWKRALVIFLTLAIAFGLLLSGALYAQYKMYTDWQEYTPAQYAIAVDENGLLTFEYASDGRHGYCGMGYGFEGEQDVFYITPHISAWPQLFDRVRASEATVLRDVRLRDGQLVFIECIVSDRLVFNEECGDYMWEKDYRRKGIAELRIGTPENYRVAYRAGDVLPIVDSGRGDASQLQ